MKLTFTLTDDNDKVLSSETMAGPGVAIGFDVAEKWRLTQFGDDGSDLEAAKAALIAAVKA